MIQTYAVIIHSHARSPKCDQHNPLIPAPAIHTAQHLLQHHTLLASRHPARITRLALPWLNHWSPGSQLGFGTLAPPPLRASPAVWNPPFLLPLPSCLHLEWGLTAQLRPSGVVTASEYYSGTTMTPAFVVLLDRNGDSVRGKLLDFPHLTASGPSVLEVEAALKPQLAQAVFAWVEEHNVLPEPGLAPAGREHLLLPLPDTTYQEKAGEKLLDFAKAEFDRVLASTRLAEDRAKQNGTFALAAVPVLTFLRLPEPPLWYVLGQLLALVLIVAILVLVALTLKSATLNGIGWTPQELEDEQETVLRGYRPYAHLLYILQVAWTKGIRALGPVRDRRFALVDWQQGLLIILAVVVLSLLVVPAALRLI